MSRARKGHDKCNRLDVSSHILSEWIIDGPHVRTSPGKGTVDQQYGNAPTHFVLQRGGERSSTGACFIFLSFLFASLHQQQVQQARFRFLPTATTRGGTHGQLWRAHAEEVAVIRFWVLPVGRTDNSPLQIF